MRKTELYEYDEDVVVVDEGKTFQSSFSANKFFGLPEILTVPKVGEYGKVKGCVIDYQRSSNTHYPIYHIKMNGGRDIVIGGIGIGKAAPAQKMTVSEIEAKLGHRVEVVADK